MIYSRYSKGYRETKEPKQEQQLELPLEDTNGQGTKRVAKTRDTKRTRKAKPSNTVESSDERESSVVLPIAQSEHGTEAGDN